MTGFKGRSGRQFRAKLKLEQDEEGKWRVEFDEEWATSPRARPSEDDASSDGAAATPTNGSNEGEPEAEAAQPAPSAS